MSCGWSGWRRMLQTRCGSCTAQRSACRGAQCGPRWQQTTCSWWTQTGCPTPTGSMPWRRTGCSTRRRRQPWRRRWQQRGRRRGEEDNRKAEMVQSRRMRGRTGCHSSCVLQRSEVRLNERLHPSVPPGAAGILSQSSMPVSAALSSVLPFCGMQAANQKSCERASCGKWGDVQGSRQPEADLDGISRPTGWMRRNAVLRNPKIKTTVPEARIIVQGRCSVTNEAHAGGHSTPHAGAYAGEAVLHARVQRLSSGMGDGEAPMALRPPCACRAGPPSRGAQPARPPAAGRSRRPAPGSAWRPAGPTGWQPCGR